MFAIDAEGRVVAWNKATEEMTGVKAKDMLGKGGYECAVPFYGEKRRLLANILLEAVDIEKYSPRIAQEYPAVWKENDILMTEANLANVNGKPMIAWAKAAPLYDKNGKLSAVIQTVRDITERKNVEEEAKRNYAVQSVISALQKLALEDISLDQILDRSLDIILGISWFDLGGKAAIFTVEADADILVMSAQRGLSPANQEACRRIEFGQCLCGKAARDKELEFALDVEGCHKISYAEIIPHGHYCVPILSIDRKTIGVLTIYSKDGQSRDQSKEEFLQLVANVLAGIIQRKYAEAALEKAYEQLKQTQSQLVQSSKMASVGELAGGVAHEINNPLTGVLNNVQLVKMMAREKKDFSMEEYRDILNCIEESALRCKRITESLLTFSHVASGLFQPVSLNDAVEK
jgi:Signal transduction histidine kinase regulating C4-dicarboxylate transport system